MARLEAWVPHIRMTLMPRVELTHKVGGLIADAR
eukprot:CAMPEP_0174703742 /NCGR_PEP_ID=MMETSP1094-20130205/7578_1 /TAXON_ID=156173 /ORGANISM="Chrysochromulina brevifilum, Strain UTEX LB 985" /LENGTH=33 /DNA_ID= /DNA_START= /DNA_END= /DNA_ORIENTATION=